MRKPNFTTEQPDGARWEVYEDPEDIRRYTILTSAGQDLLKGDKKDELRSLVDRYRAVELGSIALLGEDPNIRKELGRGREAVVYSMGPYAVRERVGISDVYGALSELTRMDEINSFMEHGLPRWLNLPVHYALHARPDRQEPKTFILMDRIDSGVTAEDIIDYPDIDPARAQRLKSYMGEAGIAEAKGEIPTLYDRAHEVLAGAIEAGGKDPAKYLTDWEPRNALVERLSTPVAGSNYTINVIDQYRA